MIYWLTGQPGAGKTTIAKEMLSDKECYAGFHIDGDHIREIFDNKDYSEVGRRRNVEIAQFIAEYLHREGEIVIVSMVSPYKDQRLEQNKNVLICIRDVEPDEKNPFTAEEVEINIKQHLWRFLSDGRVKVMIIPDIESVNFGRGVGYDIIEHIPPDNIKEISATKIREEMKKDGFL